MARRKCKVLYQRARKRSPKSTVENLSGFIVGGS